MMSLIRLFASLALSGTFRDAEPDSVKYLDRRNIEDKIKMCSPLAKEETRKNKQKVRPCVLTFCCGYARFTARTCISSEYWIPEPTTQKASTCGEQKI